MRHMQFTVETKREPDGNPVFFFHGSFRGEDFCGTADDLNTALSMVSECLELCGNPNA